jgi:hypothetical protein
MSKIESRSCQPCGCDIDAGWTCVQHALPYAPVKSAKAHFADTMNTLLEEDRGEPVKVRVYTPQTGIRTFATGATRDGDTSKPDYEGFQSPLVNKRFGQYMHQHRIQADGSLRSSDNWQKGIPFEQYVKSLVRHIEDLRLHHDNFPEEAVDKDIENVLSAIIFNASGALFETLRGRRFTK